MDKRNIPEPDLDNLLKQTLKDDLPPDATSRMKRQFLSLKRTLEQTESSAEAGISLWSFRKEVLAFASLLVLILAGLMNFGGHQSALADSISRLKVIVDVTECLNRATSMDCSVLKRDAGNAESRYRVRWNAAGITRVDMDSANGGKRTLWISDAATSPDPLWQPALEFMTPAILVQRMEKHYRLMQTGDRVGGGPDDFLLVGRENQQIIEITVDGRTYLPKTLKKYSQDSSTTGTGRICLMEIQFLWNQPISQALLVPAPQAAKRRGSQ